MAAKHLPVVLALLSLALCFNIAGATSPTFDASGGNLNGTDLICSPLTNCNITCPVEGACASTTVNASLTTNLYIECSANNACNEMNVVSGPTNTLKINCAASDCDTSSCDGMVIDVVNTHSVDIECGNDGCWNMRIVVDNIQSLYVQSAYAGNDNSTFRVSNTNSVAFQCISSGTNCFYDTAFYMDNVDDIMINASAAYGLANSYIHLSSDVTHSDGAVIYCGDYGSCWNLNISAAGYASKYVLIEKRFCTQSLTWMMYYSPCTSNSVN